MSGLALSQLSWRLRALSSRLEKLSCRMATNYTFSNTILQHGKLFYKSSSLQNRRTLWHTFDIHKLKISRTFCEHILATLLSCRLGPLSSSRLTVTSLSSWLTVTSLSSWLLVAALLSIWLMALSGWLAALSCKIFVFIFDARVLDFCKVLDLKARCWCSMQLDKLSM